MQTERRVVNNRVFLLGLDELYREAMKRHEAGELLSCAREAANALDVAPADVPIEGYYTEDKELTEYFRLVRTLQQVPKGRESEVASLAGFKRLKEVTQSPIFGPTCVSQYLLSAGEDALSVALRQTFPGWSVDNLTDRAYECAAESADFSLVALAALSRDPVILTALRESVVLYAERIPACAMWSEPQYVWEVDEIVQQRAMQFVETFNELLSEGLPRPAPENAKDFWMASSDWKIIGRCVRIGFDPRAAPIRHYHWAIGIDAKHQLVVTEFWDTEIWTTAQFRAKHFHRL
jgi:hypothetical protein